MLTSLQSGLISASLALLLGTGTAFAGTTVVDPADDPGESIAFPDVSQSDVGALTLGGDGSVATAQLAQAIAATVPGTPEAQAAVAAYLVVLLQAINADGLPPMTQAQRDTVRAIVTQMLAQMPGNPQLTSLLTAL